MESWVLGGRCFPSLELCLPLWKWRWWGSCSVGLVEEWAGNEEATWLWACAHWMLRKCWLLLLFPIWNGFREKKDFSWGDGDFGTLLSVGAFSSPETAFIFLSDSQALSKGLVQTNGEEACSLISHVFGGGLRLHGHGEELVWTIVLRFQVVIVWGDGRFLISWCARQASTSTSDPWDPDTKVL